MDDLFILLIYMTGAGLALLAFAALGWVCARVWVYWRTGK